jgi:hypothetical protein
MANDHHAHDHGDFQPGQMDIGQHLKGWQGFTNFVKWSLVGILVVMVLLAIFRTH